MCTTPTLDDDVAARLKTEVRRTGRPFEQPVNECIRRGFLLTTDRDFIRFRGLRLANPLES